MTPPRDPSLAATVKADEAAVENARLNPGLLFHSSAH